MSEEFSCWQRFGKNLFTSSGSKEEPEASADELNYLQWRVEKGVAEGSTEIPKGAEIPLEYKHHNYRSLLITSNHLYLVPLINNYSIILPILLLLRILVLQRTHMKRYTT